MRPAWRFGPALVVVVPDPRPVVEGRAGGDAS